MQTETAASNFNALFISRTVTLEEKNFSRTVNNSAILSTLPTVLVKTFYSLHGPLWKHGFIMTSSMVLASFFCSCPAMPLTCWQCRWSCASPWRWCHAPAVSSLLPASACESSSGWNLWRRRGTGTLCAPLPSSSSAPATPQKEVMRNCAGNQERVGGSSFRNGNMLVQDLATVAEDTHRSQALLSVVCSIPAGSIYLLHCHCGRHLFLASHM